MNNFKYLTIMVELALFHIITAVCLSGNIFGAPPMMTTIGMWVMAFVMFTNFAAVAMDDDKCTEMARKLVDRGYGEAFKPAWLITFLSFIIIGLLVNLEHYTIGILFFFSYTVFISTRNIVSAHIDDEIEPLTDEDLFGIDNEVTPTRQLSRGLQQKQDDLANATSTNDLANATSTNDLELSKGEQLRLERRAHNKEMNSRLYNQEK